MNESQPKQFGLPNSIHSLPAADNLTLECRGDCRWWDQIRDLEVRLASECHQIEEHWLRVLRPSWWGFAYLSQRTDLLFDTGEKLEDWSSRLRATLLGSAERVQLLKRKSQSLWSIWCSSWGVVWKVDGLEEERCIFGNKWEESSQRARRRGSLEFFNLPRAATHV